MIHKAEYLMPGSFFPEETYRTLEERTILEAVTQAPPSAFCFILYDVAETPPLAPDLLEQFSVTPKRQNVSGRYYLGGQVFDLPELRAWIDANGGDDTHYALYANIEGNGYTRAIRCRTGNWQPFEDNDVLVEMPE